MWLRSQACDDVVFELALLGYRWAVVLGFLFLSLLALLIPLLTHTMFFRLQPLSAFPACPLIRLTVRTGLVYPGSRPLSYIKLYRWDGYLFLSCFLPLRDVFGSICQNLDSLKVERAVMLWVRLSLICHSQLVFLCLSGSFRSCTCMTFGFLSRMLLQNNESSFQALVTGWQQRNICRVPVIKTQFIRN